MTLSPSSPHQEGSHFYPHVSVDCVILGYDGEALKVLLSRRSDENPQAGLRTLKLPGRLLYTNEDIDEAASDIITQLTGSDRHYIHQFKAFGSPHRTSNPRDVLWLENAVKLKIGRLVTIGYMTLIRINERNNRRFAGLEVEWHRVDELPELAFDHNHIISEALMEMERISTMRPQLIFEMLPPKFTALQLRRLHEQILGKSLDVRNFHKQVMTRSYIIPLDEYEVGVAHRAARYYKFQVSKKK